MSDPTPVPAVPAPKPGGSSALKIILIVLGSIALLFLLVVAGGMYACSHFIHKTMEKHGEKATINIPGAGSFSAKESKSYSAEELGTEIYPGAVATEGGSKLDIPTGTITTAIFSTSDPVSKVADFYKSKLGSSSAFSTDSTAMISRKISDNETVAVTISSKDNEDGKTKIIVMHTRKK